MTIEEIWHQIEESFTKAVIKAFAERDMKDQIWIDPRQCSIVVSPSSTYTAEYIKVVRCKNCKYRDNDAGTCYGRGSPYQFVPDDGYCDRGKGRENVEV